jgi:hypothetical protein
MLLCCLHYSLRTQLQAWTLRHCEAVSVLNSQLQCHCSGINMAGPLSVFTKEEQRAVIRFLWAEGVQGQKSIKDFQQNMGTVLCCSVVCMNGFPCSKTAAQVSLIMNDADACPRPLQERTLNESVP